MSRWFACCLGAVILWGIWGLTFSAASGMMPPLMALVLSTAGLLPVVGGLLFAKGVWNGQRLRKGVAWGIVTGLAGALGNVAFSQAIVQGGEASVITPLTAMYPLITLILAKFFLRERINLIQGGGIVIALASILLFNGFSGADSMATAGASLASPWMVSALVCLLLFGVQGISQKLSTNDISNELSTICYLVGSGLVAGGVLATQQLDWSLPAEAWALGLGSGVAMGLALWVGFAAYRGGTATVVTALIALYPVVTVLLAIPLLGDSMNVVKAAAIGLALLAGLALTYEKAAGTQLSAAQPLAGLEVD